MSSDEEPAEPESSPIQRERLASAQAELKRLAATAVNQKGKRTGKGYTLEYKRYVRELTAYIETDGSGNLPVPPAADVTIRTRAPARSAASDLETWGDANWDDSDSDGKDPNLDGDNNKKTSPVKPGPPIRSVPDWGFFT